MRFKAAERLDELLACAPAIFQLKVARSHDLERGGPPVAIAAYCNEVAIDALN